MEINLGDVILAKDINGKKQQIKISSIIRRNGKTIYREQIRGKHYLEAYEEDVIGIYRCESCGRELVRQGKCYCEYFKTGKIKLYKINEPIKCDNPEF